MNLHLFFSLLGLFFPVFGHLHPVHLTPDYSIMIQAGLAILMLLLSNIENLLGYFTLSYALQNVCSVVSDVKSLQPPDYKFDGDAPDLKVIAYQRERGEEKLVLVWSAQLNTEKTVGHPRCFTFAHPKKPKKVLLTDLYWGLEQRADWPCENGQVKLAGLVVRDYPVVISVR